MLLVLYLSFVVASISFAVTETKFFLPMRTFLQEQSYFFGFLFSCNFCLGYWISFVLTFIYQPRLFYGVVSLDYFFTAVVIAWFAGLQCMVVSLLFDKIDK